MPGRIAEVTQLPFEIQSPERLVSDVDEQLQAARRPGQVEGSADPERRGDRVPDRGASGDAHPHGPLEVPEVGDAGRRGVPLQEEGPGVHGELGAGRAVRFAGHDPRARSLAPDLELGPRDGATVRRPDRMARLDGRPARRRSPSGDAGPCRPPGRRPRCRRPSAPAGGLPGSGPGRECVRARAGRERSGGLRRLPCVQATVSAATAIERSARRNLIVEGYGGRVRRARAILDPCLPPSSRFGTSEPSPTCHTTDRRPSPRWRRASGAGRPRSRSTA